MIVALQVHALVRIAHASWTLSAARLSMCVRRYAGRLWHSWRGARTAMLVTLLGAVRRPSGDLTTKNNQSRYHENNY